MTALNDRSSSTGQVSLAGVLPYLQAKNLVNRTHGQFGTLSDDAAVVTDSRKVTAGAIFIAYKGVASDGHVHLVKAIERGAGLLIVENLSRLPAGATIPAIEVKSGRAAWAYLASLSYNHPENDLHFLGVTGTNGKTSTVWMTSSLLRAAGIPCLSIGTLGASYGDGFIPTGHTTPDPDLLFRLLADAKARGIRHVAMEVSSHAIAQEKLLPLRFDAAAFTSFSRDHLDFHQTLEEYFAAKWQLFTCLMRPNSRMVFWDGLDALPLETLTGETVSYSNETTPRPTKAQKHLHIKIERTDFQGTTLVLESLGRSWRGTVPYFAKHALENFAAAFLLVEKALDNPPPPEKLDALSPVPGRLEQVLGPASRPSVIVDYAHTPDALEKTLVVLRPLCTGRLVVVFGCGGDRDKGKRAQMGRIAEHFADQVYITSDNPRSEEPLAIIDNILAGLSSPEKAYVEPDRARAIQQAVSDSTGEDTVLVAGKGHETYQIVQGQTLPFDDREVARQALNR